MSTIEMTHSGLLVPSLQAEPFPISRITPSPCTQACPAGINVKAYVSLIAEKKFREALETIRRRCPLPGICGRVCHHPCETACKRGRYDEPISIRSLKRFVADVERDAPGPSAVPIQHQEKIAIIGSGPAGLTAAFDLRLAGYRVTVFEAESEPGGMLRYGIADYRLPREVLNAEIDILMKAGVEIRTGMRLGRHFKLHELSARGYAATVLAVGAQRGRLLGLPAEHDTREVEDALSFLRGVKLGERTRLPGRVVVIGGGSTAVEAARTALRLGAQSVEVLYRRYREELLADHEEVEAAESEGVRFRFLVAPKRLIRKNESLEALECVKIGLGEPDATGRRRPIEIPGSEFVVETNHILAAVGQETDFSFAIKNVLQHIEEKGRVRIDPATAMTSIPGLFAAGDAVTGPATVVEAIGAGHRAAESIRHFLQEGHAGVREQKPERRAAVEYELPDPEPLRAGRIRVPLAKRADDREFAEVERSFSAEEAVAEARRCLRCGPCGECRSCAPSCSRRHVMVRHQDNTILLRAPGSVALALGVEKPTAARLLQHIRPGTIREFDSDAAIPAEVLPVRTRVTSARCRGCSRCVEVCPFGALSISGNGEGRATVHLEAAVCRGCGICAAVCPTHTVVQSVLSPEWWSERLDAVLARATVAESAPSTLDAGSGREAERYLVLACQRRAGALEKSLEDVGHRVDIIRLRCIGQVDAGMLLELYGQPFRSILLAGCETQRCRFGDGARLAAEQFARAQVMLKSLGLDPSRIVADWSPDRVGDLLDPAVAAMMAFRGRGH